MAAFIVLLGPPGAGKGTQAELLAKQIHMPHVSSGELFRENVKHRTALGRRVQEFMARGELVPDDLTIAMVEERLSRADCGAGAILDGFPRTPSQADALDAMLARSRVAVTLVPFIAAPQEVLVERAGGRLTCRAHGHIYHRRFSPPLTPGKCDIDGSELYQRDDDKAATVARRIEVYLKETAPLVEHYRAQGKLVEIDGTQGIAEVTAALLQAIEK
jgi:adenylate kinase